MSTPVQNEERLLKVIVGPHISEKATLAGEINNQYTFKVLPDAKKPEIKRAVEYLFNVEVESVQVCNIKGKKKRFGKITGRRNGVRKAYVRLKEGNSIEFIRGE